MKHSHFSPKTLNNIGAIVARMAVRRALKQFREIRHRSAFIIGAKLPSSVDKSIYEKALAKELCWREPMQWMPDDLLKFHYFSEDKISSNYRRKKPFEAYSLAKDVGDHPRIVGVGTPKYPISSSFAAITEAVLELQTDPKHVAAALYLARGIHVTEEEANELCLDTLTNLNIAFRGPRPATSAFRILRALRKVDSAEAQTASNMTASRHLEDMAGYGEAKVWGLDLARDIRDWKDGKISWTDVDRGALLIGSPGTGKTIYARALAKTCGAHFVECSLSKMQALGHLGDMLKGIGRVFKDAQTNVPAILFLDEFDAVGNRETLSSHAPEYTTQVITGLLQLMDGTEKRDGVVVVAACNRLETIDTAFLRPGRLDRIIEIPLPDFEARKMIFSQNLQLNLADLLLTEIGLLTNGMSGADLEQLARDVRRAARRAGKATDEQHLMSLLSQKFVEVPSSELRRLAVHEAGHVVASHAIQGVIAHEVSVKSRVLTTHAARYESGGCTVFQSNRSGLQTRTDYLDNIAILLAGHAAETLLFGSPSDGSGLIAGSDLERATLIAARLNASSGLCDDLVFRSELTSSALKKLIKDDASIAKSCNRILLSQRQRVMSILKSKQDQIQTIADELVDSKILFTKQISSLLNSNQIH